MIYANSADRKVFLDVPVTPVNNTIDVVVKQGGLVVHTFETVTFDNSRYYVTIPFKFAQSDAELEIEWSFDYLEEGESYSYKNSMFVEVVTPILTPREIKEVWEDATPTEVNSIEKSVRHIINAFTGQTFGKFVGVKSVAGTNSTALMLPQRLLQLKQVNGAEGYFSVDSGGWILRHYPWGAPPVKADADGYHMHVGGVIHNPNNVRLGVLSRNNTYDVDGVWGWNNVPEQIKEAARLLVNDYSCMEQQYRDRYLVSMTAADWRIQFDSGAYADTGNVRADQLLREFVVPGGWAVL